MDLFVKQVSQHAHHNTTQRPSHDIGGVVDPKVHSGIADQEGAGVGDERKFPETQTRHGGRSEQITGVIGWKRETVGTVGDVLKIGKGVAGPVPGHEFFYKIVTDEIVQTHKGRSGNDEGQPALFKKTEDQDQQNRPWDNKILFDRDE